MDGKHGMTCTAAMERFHRVLDGDLMDASERQGMETHLAVCAECAGKAAQLREMQDLLRGMAEQPMPDEAVDEVWRRTMRAPRGATRRGLLDWRFAAAAAVIVFATWIGVRQFPVIQGTGPDEEALRAAQEVRMVLQLTANAIKKSEEVAIREVFAEEVSPALEKVGILWRSARERSGDEGSI